MFELVILQKYYRDLEVIMAQFRQLYRIILDEMQGIVGRAFASCVSTCN